MMVVAHNLMAQNANRQFGKVSVAKGKSTEKLSSGYRINRAADDAAGLAISEKMRAQVRGLNRASMNIQDGISVCQIADGALQEVHNILQRMNELSIYAANGTLTPEDRNHLQNEVGELKDAIDKIADTTVFNDEIYPLKGSVMNVDNNSAPPSSSTSRSEFPLSSEIPNGIINGVSSTSYPSYTDSSGKFHYVLGEGEFKIDDITNCVLDVSGVVKIKDTNLKNAQINCAEGTVLSVENTTIDNSANIRNYGNGVGAALVFTGKNNTLNVYGTNEFNGGMDNYTEHENGKYNFACAGINVGDGTELIINGSDTDGILNVHGVSTACNYNFPGGGTSIMAPAIGSNFHQDGGKIIIEGGTINAMPSTVYPLGGSIGIGGGYGTSIIINGGIVNARGVAEPAIGGGLTDGNPWSGYATIEINGGKINAYTDNATAAIGFYRTGYVEINEGTVQAMGGGKQTVAIGGSHIDGSGEAKVVINGGITEAVSLGEWGAGIGMDFFDCSLASAEGNVYINNGSVIAAATTGAPAIGKAVSYGHEGIGIVNVYVENNITNTYGIDNGEGNNVYLYNATSLNLWNPPVDPTRSNSSTEPDPTDVPDATDTSSELEDVSPASTGVLWIQTSGRSMEGLQLSLVDANVKTLGLIDADVSTEEYAQMTISVVLKAIDKVSEYRSTFGAQQNRLEHAMAVDDNTAENTDAAESRIRDTDMAKEMVNYSKHSILEQVGQSMIAQANQTQQGIMNILG